MTRSWPRRFAILCFVPLGAFTLAHLLSPFYGDQPTWLGVLPLLLLIEAGVIIVPAVLLALVRQPILLVMATVVVTVAAVAGVWIATTVPIPDGQAGFAFVTPLYVGVIAAAALVPLDVLLGYLDADSTRSTPMKSTWALLVRGAVATTTAAVIVGGCCTRRGPPTSMAVSGRSRRSSWLPPRSTWSASAACGGRSSAARRCCSSAAGRGSPSMAVPNQLRGVFVLLALVVTLVISIAGTLADRLGEASQ